MIKQSAVMLALLLTCLPAPVLSRLPVHVPAYYMPNDNEKRVPSYLPNQCYIARWLLQRRGR